MLMLPKRIFRATAAQGIPLDLVDEWKRDLGQKPEGRRKEPIVRLRDVQRHHLELGQRKDRHPQIRRRAQMLAAKTRAYDRLNQKPYRHRPKLQKLLAQPEDADAPSGILQKLARRAHAVFKMRKVENRNVSRVGHGVPVPILGQSPGHQG